jgi:hypothetical protein
MPSHLSDHFVQAAALLALLLSWTLLAAGWVSPSLLQKLNSKLQEISARTFILLLLIPSLSLMLSAAIADRDGIPSPRVQDEFSYLLAADTFAHGRLTNPTPPFWEHFETPHELMRPTYMSKYPPGQGLSLALGMILTSLPIAGVWLTSAAACAALYWMLLAFVPKPWALLGGLLAVTHPLLLDWSRIYWGGSLAVLAASLLLGAWGRLWLKPEFRTSTLLAIGLAILANTRPYEGLILSAPLMLALLVRSVHKTNRRIAAIRIGIPLLAVLLPTFTAMGYYNFRITGHPLRMPFQEYASQYDVYPKFWFLPRNPQPVYRNQQMLAIHTVFERGSYDQARSLSGFLTLACQDLQRILTTHANPLILLLPLLAALSTINDKKIRWIWLALTALILGLLVENFYLNHYAAPATPALLLLTILGWQRLSNFKPGNRTANRFALSLAAGFFTGALLHAAIPPSPDEQRINQSALIQQSPSLQTGQHLIFVRYTPDHLIHDEWVYNQADLPTSRIIWARDLGPPSNAPLIKYFTSRTPWLLTLTKSTLTLTPYPPLPPPTSQKTAHEKINRDVDGK